MNENESYPLCPDCYEDVRTCQRLQLLQDQPDGYPLYYLHTGQIRMDISNLRGTNKG